MNKPSRFITHSGCIGVLLLASGVTNCLADENDRNEWDGFYMGASFGYSAAAFHMKSTTPMTETGINPAAGTYFANQTNADNVSASGSEKLSSSDAIAGMVLGYNKRVGMHQLAGVELDLSALHQTSETTQSTVYYPGAVYSWYAPKTRFRTSVDSFSALAIRFGTIMEHTLFYLKAGPAMSKVSFSSSFDDKYAFESNAQSQWKIGWMLGIGVEHKLQTNLSIKADYVHAEFGPVSSVSTNLADRSGNHYGNQPFRSSLETGVDIVRVGINMHF